MIRWILDPVDRDAVIANVALKNFVTPDIRVILEMSCVRSPGELLAVKQAYHSLYKHSLEEDVASHTTGNFRKVSIAEQCSILHVDVNILFIVTLFLLQTSSFK